MASLPSIIRARQHRRRAARHNLSNISSLGCSLLITLLFITVAISIVLVYSNLTKGLPSLESLPLWLDPPNGLLLQPTRLYDRSGEHLLLALEPPAVQDQSVSGDRTYLYLDQSKPHHLPENLVEATISELDPSFWKRGWIPVDGLITGDHPTLAQRLVSELLFSEEQPGLRKNLRERLLAAQATSRFGREKVLEWYLNSTKYGPLVYGPETAALVYFGKNVVDLTVSEAAFLVAVSQAPELNAYEATQIHIGKRNQVIHAMLAQGYISAEEASAAIKASINLRQTGKEPGNPAPAFTDLVLMQLATIFGRERLERGGLSIRTTLDYDLQTQSSCATRLQIERLRTGQSTLTATDDTQCEAARLLPTLPLDGRGTDSDFQANVVVIDPQSGQVLALVGDIPQSPTTPSPPGHTPGSLLTPFIYLTAFTRGLGPATLVWDIPSYLPEGLAEKYDPDAPYQGPVNLRTALANDYQIPAVQVLSQVGAENVWRIAQQLGLGSLDITDLQESLQEYPPFSAGKISILELGQAYGIFANQGVLTGQVLPTGLETSQPAQVLPITVLNMAEYSGQIWFDCTDQQLTRCLPQNRSVLSPQLAYLVTNILSDETARWPSLRHPNPLEIGRPTGAKIGQVVGENAAWTIGYTPQKVVGVWLGTNTDGKPLPEANDQTTDKETTSSNRIFVSSTAALWHAIMKYASRDTPPTGWDAPEGINHVEVCYPSGMLPTTECPVTVNEIFLPGNEPTHQDNLYRIFSINRENRRLATIFTPPELIQENVYLVIPPNAEDWARASGVALLPDNYDVINASGPSSPSVMIASPEMFAHVSGVVKISGSASAKDFSFYRIQVAKGLNPREWIQIGQDATNRIENGVLGEWDTGGLSGLYAVQLQVVHQDQRVETTTIQVTVDNEAPKISILNPTAGEKFAIRQNIALSLVADASDDIALERVEYYIDNKLIVTLRLSPFTVAWQPKTGQHVLLVRAYDQAGNSSQATVIFNVQ